MARKKAADAPTEEQEAKGGSKKLIIVVAAVVVLAVLGAGAMAGGLIGGGDAAAAAGTEAAVDPTEEPRVLGRLMQLESVTLNLAEGRFLKLGVAVELAEGVAEDPPTPPIYDEVISLFGPMTFDQLRDPGIREQTKASLLEGLAELYGEDIVGVYYTEFVMQ